MRQRILEILDGTFRLFEPLHQRFDRLLGPLLLLIALLPTLIAFIINFEFNIPHYTHSMRVKVSHPTPTYQAIS